MMIYGIPYFGKEEIEFIDVGTREFESLYDIIEEYAYRKVAVEIDGKWFTWLKDICFNYRDRELYLPYYKYDIAVTDKKYGFRKDYHILKVDGKVALRYNFELQLYKIDDSIKELVLLDIENKERIRVSWDKYISSNALDINKLYKLYLNSCYKDFGDIALEHDGGYHYIDRSVAEFKNMEHKLRNEFGLTEYSKNSIKLDDYRDVREYSYNEIIRLKGLQDSFEIYKLRRLRFESYLYCCMRDNLNPDGIPDWSKLGKGLDYIKYGKGIKLIIKAYWLNEFTLFSKKRSWSRI